MKRINLLLALTLLLSFSACKKDSVKKEKGEFAEGIFIVNEGQFGHGNASVSFTDKNVSTIENDIYNSINNLDLGDQAQSIGFSDDKAYIVVTGSNKIEVVDAETMKKTETISSDLTNPRYFETVDSSTALVTCWGDPADETDDYLAIVNTNNNAVTGQIAVDLGPEKMVKNDDYLFIAHKGAWGTNNKISVYDLVLKQITNTITVGDRPNSMVVKDDYLWVLCSGEPSYATTETAGQLYKIDLNDNFNIIATFDFSTTEHPDFLTGDGDKLYYYLDGKVYQMDKDASSLPTAEFLTYNGSGYNMEANDGKLYITDALDYSQEGKITAFDLSNGQQIGQQTAGLIPGDIGFHLE